MTRTLAQKLVARAAGIPRGSLHRLLRRHGHEERADRRRG